MIERTAITIMVAIFCLCLASPGASGSDLTPVAEAEIRHLLDYLGSSHCQFHRNGKWYTDMKAAREHAEKKLAYFSRKERVHSAEDFITWAASKSELTGKPYLVKCGDGPVETAAQWLTDELERYRKNERAPSDQRPRKQTRSRSSTLPVAQTRQSVFLDWSQVQDPAE